MCLPCNQQRKYLYEQCFGKTCVFGERWIGEHRCTHSVKPTPDHMSPVSTSLEPRQTRIGGPSVSMFIGQCIAQTVSKHKKKQAALHYLGNRFNVS